MLKLIKLFLFTETEWNCISIINSLCMNKIIKLFNNIKFEQVLSEYKLEELLFINL